MKGRAGKNMGKSADSWRKKVLRKAFEKDRG